VEFLLDEMWISELAYLVDAFFHLNNLIEYRGLHKYLQGFCTNIFVLRNRIQYSNKICPLG